MSFFLAVVLSAQSVADWKPEPAGFRGAAVERERAVLTSDPWAGLVAPPVGENGELSLTFTILEPARRLNYKGDTWCVWTDFGREDGGYEFAALLRHGEAGGYRVQVSEKFQEVALFKHPHGSFLRAAPCAIRRNAPHALKASVQGSRVSVSLDGKELISFGDHLLTLREGRFGIAVSSGARVAVENVKLRALDPGPAEAPGPHRADLAVREWRGRKWVFDGQEPILLLHTPEVPHLQNAKLLPGYRPVLMWNAYWDIQCQGAYPEGTNRPAEPRVEKRGEKLELVWDGRHEKGAFATRTSLTVACADGRYVYDVESALEVLKEFHFRQGFDFEHHTALDPFRWEYMVLRGADGKLYYRPFYPYDPGPCEDLATRKGFRAWVGRRGEPFVIGPAVEYEIAEARPMNTAVCAWAYDTGVAFPAATLKAGQKLAVKYRYTGYAAEELRAMLKAAAVWPIPRLDPRRHFVFADAWPKLDFSQAAALNESWPKGWTPFMSGHNALPQYLLEKEKGKSVLRFGPASHAAANLPAPSPLPKGRYVVSVLARGENLHGPGAYVEVLATKEHTGDGYVRHATKVLAEERHYAGAGSFDWRRVEFSTEVPSGAPAVAVGFGNAGTGDFFVADLEVRPGDAPRANAKPAPFPPAPRGAVADYRMAEGAGQHAFDFAGGPFGILELANVDWAQEGGRAVLEFGPPKEKASSPVSGGLDLRYLSQKAYRGKERFPVALAGFHGGGEMARSFALRVEAKPGAEMAPAYWGTDIAGVGARSLKVCLKEAKPPYTLGVALNFAEWFWTDARLEADRWYEIAVSGEPAGEKLRLKIWLDGKVVKEAVTEKIGSIRLTPSLVLGTEIFYFDGRYRGRIGRVTIFDRALDPDEMK